MGRTVSNTPFGRGRGACHTADFRIKTASQAIDVSTINTTPRLAIIGLLVALVAGVSVAWWRLSQGDASADASPAPTAGPSGSADDHKVESTSVSLRKASQPPASGADSRPISDIDPSEALLDPERQQYVWDSEHITHMLEWRFGPKFKQAFSQKSTSSVGAFLASDFSALIPTSDEHQLWEKGPVRQTLLSQTNSEYSDCDDRQFATWLVNLLDDFSQVHKTSLRVLNIDRTDDAGNQWDLRLLLTANGTTATGQQIELESTHQVRCGWQEKSELDGGRILQRWELDEVFVRTCQDKLFEEVTAQYGLHRVAIPDNWKLQKRSPKKMRFQMAVDDFDRDGYLDIAIATLEGRLMLLRSDQGKRFAEATRSVGLPVQTPIHELDYSAGWIDYDNDGFPDLLLSGSLYHNEKGRRFVNVTKQSGLQFDDKLMGYAVADYDLDGLLDLYFIYADVKRKDPNVATGWIGDDRSGAENRLWRNVGGGRFVDVTEQSGASGGTRQTLAANWLFADDDHYPDLYLANDFGTNLLLRNRGDGTFEDISESSGTSDFATSMGVATGDLDDDGLPEIYVANMYSKMGRRIIAQVGPEDYPPGIYEQIKGACAGNRLYRAGSGSQRYQEFGEDFRISGVGWAYAPAMLDCDRDGRLDLYATTGFMSFDRKKPDG